MSAYRIIAPFSQFVLWAGAALISCGVLDVRAEVNGKNQTQLADYVRPFVGAQGEGNTFPGPSAPFGLVQLSPDTDKTNWDTASGYEYTDPTILGFSLTHLSGTGCPDLGDFLFMPQVGKPAFVSGLKDHPAEGYQSAFSHADESASAGYYKVKLQKSGVAVELTAGERAGILRFTFPASDEASIMTDLSHVINGGRWRIAQSRVRIEDGSTITGFHLVNGWAKERYLYFAARYSRPFNSAEIISAGKLVIYNTYRFRSHNEAAGTNLQFFAHYKTQANEVIQVKVAVSAVSAANALENLDAEIPGWDFARLLAATREKWNRELSKIEIEGSPEQKETFYTSLYHAFLAPNLYQDKNGEYRGFDQKMEPRIEQDRNRGFTGTEGNILHFAVSRVSRAQSLSGQKWRVSRLRSKYPPGERVHRILGVFAVGYFSRRASALYADPVETRCGHDQCDACSLRPERGSPAADVGTAGQ